MKPVSHSHRDGWAASKLDPLFSGEASLAGAGCACGASRRTVLKGLALLGAGALLSNAWAFAGQTPAKLNRISVHHHLAPPTWMTAMLSRHILPQPQIWKGWSEQRCLEDMDRAGVDLSILSVTAPGVGLGDFEATRRLTRECNDYSAKMVSNYKGRYGMFGTVHLPDIEGTLSEIAYCMDTLKADGIGVFTSYGDKYLGDPIWVPIYQELDRRKAVLYTHPGMPACCLNLDTGVQPAAIEFATDTTRAIAKMIFSGTARQYPNMRVIFSHAGGTMPFLRERFTGELRLPGKENQPKDALDVLNAFYYDTAQSANPVSMRALREVVPVSQIVFGSDYPFRTSEEHVKALKEGGVFTAAELRAIDRDNAVRLWPRYA